MGKHTFHTPSTAPGHAAPAKTSPQLTCLPPQAESLGAGPGVAPNESGEWLAGPGVRNIGAPLPFLLIDLADGGAKGREEYCLNNEAFAPVLPPVLLTPLLVPPLLRHLNILPNLLSPLNQP